MKIGVRFVYDSHTFIQHPKPLDQREEQTVQHVQNILKNTQKVCFKMLTLLMDVQDIVPLCKHMFTCRCRTVCLYVATFIRKQTCTISSTGG